MSDRLASIGIGPKATIGAVTLLVVAVIIVTSYTGALTDLFAGSKPSYVATFSNTATLKRGDPVRVHGVQVGVVEKINAVDGDRATRVKFTVDKSAGDIHRDAHATVAWRSVLGGSFVVNVDPGTTGSLGSDGIPKSQTNTQVELDDVASVINGNARQGLQRLPHELAQTFAQPGQPKQVLHALAQNSPDLDKGLDAARGADKDADLRALVAQTARTVRAIDDPGQVRSVVAGAAATVRATADREADLQTTLATAPGVMRTTNATLTDLDQTLDIAHPLVTKLTDPAGDVAPTLRDLHPVLTDASTLLTKADPLLHKLRPALRSTAITAKQGVPLLDALQPSFQRLDKTILPYMAEKDPETQHSAAEMVGPGAGGLAMVASPLDNNGHYLRFPASSGSSSVYLPCQEYVGNPDKAKLVECRSLQEDLNTFLNYNPEGPDAGTAAASGDTSPRGK